MLNAFFVFLLTLSTSAFAIAQVTTGVSGKPYSAEQTTESVQTLADGTQIRQFSSNQKVYRDWQGRTRTERQMSAPMIGANPAELPTAVNIFDPVAHVQYFFDTQNKTVRRLELPTQAPRGSVR